MRVVKYLGLLLVCALLPLNIVFAQEQSPEGQVLVSGSTKLINNGKASREAYQIQQSPIGLITIKGESLTNQGNPIIRFHTNLSYPLNLDSAPATRPSYTKPFSQGSESFNASVNLLSGLKDGSVELFQYAKKRNNNEQNIAVFINRKAEDRTEDAEWSVIIAHVADSGTITFFQELIIDNEELKYGSFRERLQQWLVFYNFEPKGLPNIKTEIKVHNTPPPAGDVNNSSRTEVPTEVDTLLALKVVISDLRNMSKPDDLNYSHISDARGGKKKISNSNASSSNRDSVTISARAR